MEINTRSIIEIMGYPSEHIMKVIDNIVTKLGQNPRLEIIKKDITPPEKVKEKMFSAFVEMEIKFTDIRDLYLYCIEFLPTSIEVLDAEEIKLKTTDFTSSLNEVIAHLHKYNTALHNAHSQLNAAVKKLNQGKPNDASQNQ